MRTFALSTFVLALVMSFGLPLVVIAADAGSGTAAGSRNAGTGTISPPASGAGSGQSISLINPLKGGGDLESLLKSILDFIIRIGTIAVILMIVFVGYKFVVAQGNPGEIEAAKKMLLWTVVGALILLGAKAISAGIQATVQALSAGK